MKTFTAGRFTVDIFDGYPVSVNIATKHANGSEVQEPIKIEGGDMLDLQYVVGRAVDYLKEPPHERS